jgi:HEAT repeat protein
MSEARLRDVVAALENEKLREGAASVLPTLAAHQVSTMGELRESLKSGRLPGEPRATSCWLLGHLGGPADAPILIGLLADTSPQVAVEAAKLLALSEAPGASAGLMRMLSSPHPLCRRVAAQSLGQLGDESSVAAILALSNDDPDFDVRVEAVEALGWFPGSPHFDAIFARAQSAATDADPRMRFGAAYCLSQLMDERTRPALVVLSGDQAKTEHGVVAGFALFGLKQLDKGKPDEA